MRYKYLRQPGDIPAILEEIKTDKPIMIGIDTETTGLDPKFDVPFVIPIGYYYNNNGQREYKRFIIETLNPTQLDIANLQIFFDYLETNNIKQIYHNAKYDIEMIKNIGVNYEPKNFACTLIMAKHVDHKNYRSVALKNLKDYYGIGSVFPELERLAYDYQQAANPQSKYQVIKAGIRDGLIPDSEVVLQRVEEIINPAFVNNALNYFDKLLFRSEDLIKDYREAQTKDIETKWENFAKTKGTDIAIKDCYKIITNAYSFGPEYEQARLLLREFNTTYLGFRDEWAPIFKDGKQYNFPSYLDIYNKDSAALLMYADMDVKLTLDLFEYLVQLSKEYNFTLKQWEIVRQDWETILPIIMQEQAGLAIDKEYIEEKMYDVKKALHEINSTIASKFDIVAGGADWRDYLDLEVDIDGSGEDELLKATSYAKFTKFFGEFVPYLKLPTHADPKSKNKIDSVKKLVYLSGIVNSDDVELKELLISLNKSSMLHIVGKENSTMTELDKYFKQVAINNLQQRKDEIEEAAAKGKKLGWLKDHRLLLDILDKWDTLTIEERLLAATETKLSKTLNDFVKERKHEYIKVQRTVNNKNMYALLRTDIDALDIPNEQKSKAFQAIEIVRLKKEEASLLKWIGVYMVKLLGQHSISKDGRIRTSYLIAGPVTGRLSADVQQFPKKPLFDPFQKDDQGNKVILYHPRKAIVVKPTDDIDEPVVHAYLDFSQIELRGAAEYTMRYHMPDVALLRAYIPYACYNKELGQHNVKEHKKIWKQYDWYEDEEMTKKWVPTDLHALPVRTAFEHLRDIDLGENSTDDPALIKELNTYRGAAKGINFGILYGSGLNGILGNSGLIDFSRESLTAIYNAQKETYLNLAKWQKTVIDIVKNNGQIANLQGRIYKQGFKIGKNQYGKLEYSDAYLATNYVVQGEAAGVLKQCMIRVYNYIKENNLKTKLLQNIHDEIAYLIPKSEIEHIWKFQEIMQDIEWWDITLVSDVEVALDDWSNKIGIETNEKLLEVTKNL